MKLITQRKFILATLFVTFAATAWAGDVTDVLDLPFVGISGTAYQAFENKISNSDAEYTGQCAGGNSAIQLRSNNNTSGIVSTTSGGTLKQVAVKWNSNTDGARIVQIYGSNSVYQAAADLYGDNKGTLLGELKCSEATNGVSTLDVDGTYTYVGLRSKSGAMYLDEVDITWSTGGSTPTVAKPVFTPGSSYFIDELTFSISAEEGATIHFTFDETDPTPESPICSTLQCVTETSTIKAIAVKNNVSSAVASATYTKMAAITIAEAQATAAGNTVGVVGTVVASAAGGAVIYDNSDYLFYYNTNNALEVGQAVSMIGSLSAYGGANQMPSSATVTQVGTGNVTYPAPEVLDGAAFDAIKTAGSTARKYVSFVGTLTISNNKYFNIAVEGATEATASLVKPKEDLSALDGQEVEVKGYLMYVNNQYVYVVATSVQPFTQELLVNSAFDPQANPLGWTKNTSNGYNNIGMFQIGTGKVHNDFAPSTVDDTHLATEFAAGFECRWQTNYASYEQTITNLAAGTYRLTYDVENVNEATTGADYDNRFVVSAGSNVYTDGSVEWMYGPTSWTKHSIMFTLDDAADVVISLGYGTGSNNLGQANTPVLYVSHLKLEQLSELEVALAELEETIQGAENYFQNYPIGDDLFMYSSSEMQPLASAITAAQGVFNAPESLAAVQQATQTLNNALSSFNPQKTLPDPNKTYALLSRSAGRYMTLTADGVSISEKPHAFYFEAATGNKYYLTDGTYYVGLAGTNNWTMSSDPDKKEAITFGVQSYSNDPEVPTYYILFESKGRIGVDYPTNDGCWANKTGMDNNVQWTIVEYVAPLELTLNVKRPAGKGYDVTTATVDFTEAKAALGVDAITADMFRVVNPSTSEMYDYAAYDGWFNADGVATTWGADSKVCVKFYQAVSDGSYQICDMNNADVVGTTYTTKWAIVANEKEVFYTINVTITEAPDPNLIEIAQSQSPEVNDGANRATVVQGDEYTQYTTQGDISVIIKILDVDIKDCDYVVVNFAEPVPSGLHIAFWDKNGTANVDVPEGATEYKYVFADDPNCAIQNDILPQITMLTLWAANKVVKISGVYKHKAPVQEVEPLALTLNVERYVGQGYTPTNATVDFTQAKTFLGVDEITADMVRIVNPDATEISEYAQYDGWFNADGVATGWGTTTKINVKFFEAVPNGTYTICDMNDADVVNQTYTVKWALVANNKKVIYTINVKFVEQPSSELSFSTLNKLDEQTVALSSDLGMCYEALTADVDVAGILTTLGATALSDVTIYAVQSDGKLDSNYGLGTTDGWRNADGDWQSWGDNAFFYVKADFSLESAQLYEIGGMAGKNTTTPATYTATYAFVKTGTSDAVVLNVTLSYKALDLTYQDLDKKGEMTVDITSTLGKSYEGIVADVDMDAILDKLGGIAFEDVDIYAVWTDGTLDKNYGVGSTDGWRNLDGNWQTWGDNARFCIKADFSKESGQLYYVGGMDGQNTETPVTYTASYVFVKKETNQAVLLLVNLTYEEAVYYNIAVAETENGTVTVNKNQASAGETIVLVATPAEGYELDEATITYGGETVQLTSTNGKTVSFTMPAADVTAKVTFKEVYVDPNAGLTEIDQDQGASLDDFARTDFEKGQDYNTYTATADLQVAFKMYDVDVNGCDYVLIKFAEPVSKGWVVAFWGQGGTDNVEVPEGATEYKYVFSEDDKCAIKDGILPQITMLTLWGAQKPLVAKVEGIYKHAAAPAETELELTLNVDRFPGMGYGVTEAKVDFTEAKAFLGVDEITTDMLRIVNPDYTEISDYAPYDGWFNGEGVATTWGANTKICVKFFQAIPNGTYQICDMNGADELGKTYTVTWALEANGKKVIYTINITFTEKPTIDITFADLTQLDVQTVALTSELGKCYEGMTADVDVAAILTKLGVASLDDVTIYAVQSDGSLDDNYKLSTTDGWRNADGDWQSWGDKAYFYVKADFTKTSGQLYEIGGMDGKNTTADWQNPATYTATYAFVKTGSKDAVVLKVTLSYATPDGINGITMRIPDATIYDLNGRKVQNVVKGHIYIVNGKKVLFK